MLGIGALGGYRRAGRAGSDCAAVRFRDDQYFHCIWQLYAGCAEKVGNECIGPQGKYYADHPAVEQPQMLYGKN